MPITYRVEELTSTVQALLSRCRKITEVKRMLENPALRRIAAARSKDEPADFKEGLARAALYKLGIFALAVA